jgi:hypothetical protein
MAVRSLFVLDTSALLALRGTLIHKDPEFQKFRELAQEFLAK